MPALSVGASVEPSVFPSLGRAILAGVGQFPDGRFLSVDREGAQQACSYAEMLRRATILLAGLRASGVQSGDTLALKFDDAEAVTAAIWAGILAGLVIAPLGGTNGAETKERLAALGRVSKALHVLTRGVTSAQQAYSGTLDFDELVAWPAPAELTPEASVPEDLRFVITTSGTTGTPRLVGLSDAAALARWWPDLPDASHAHGFLSWSSFQHVMGVSHVMPNLPLKVHLDRNRFGAAPLSWLDALDATGATHATMTNFGMSLVLRALAENPERKWDLAHVRKIGVGAEAVSGTTATHFLAALQRFGLRNDALILGYGLSECGPVVGGGLPFMPGDRANTDRTGVELDRPTRGHSVRIVDGNGRLVKEGEVGLIEVRGPTMTSGYLGDEAGTSALFTADGWLRTGDLGLLDDGKLSVSGREKELVVINARKLTCQEIEAAIMRRTGLAEVHAAPLAENEGPGAPCAIFVSLAEGDVPDPEQIGRMVRVATADAFRFAPRTVTLLSADDVPRTALGKVRRLALPALLEQPEVARRTSHIQWSNPATPASLDGQPADPEIEARLADIWRKLLHLDGPIDRDIDFFALGGDSLLALRLSFLIEEEFGVAIQIEQIRTRLSLAALTDMLGGTSAAMALRADEPVPNADSLPDWAATRLHGFLRDWPGIQTVPGGYLRKVGDATQGMPVFWCLQQVDEAESMGRTLGMRVPLHVMRSALMLLDYCSPDADALAASYAREIMAICPDGPMVLGGNCQGFNIALAVTRLLIKAGREVRLLIAADCRFATICADLPVPAPVALLAGTSSKFNPYRYFQHPEQGLRRLAPHGLRLEMIETGYTRMLREPAIGPLTRGIESAIDWADNKAASALPPRAAAPPIAYQCSMLSPLKRLELPAGGRFTFPVRVKNSSTNRWDVSETSGLALGNHWLSDKGEMVIWADGRTPLARPVEPGSRAYMALEVTAPLAPGNYLLELDMVHEGICWFAERTSSPLLVPVTVAPAGDNVSIPDRPARFQLLPTIFDWADRAPLLTRASRPKATTGVWGKLRRRLRRVWRVADAGLGIVRGASSYPVAWLGLFRPRDELAAAVAELLVVGFLGTSTRSPSARLLARQVRRGQVGGVLFVAQNIGRPERLTALMQMFRAGDSRPLIAIDHEGGYVQRLTTRHGVSQLPAARTLAATIPPDQACELYAGAGHELAALGFNINLGPVLDIDDPENLAIGRANRSYGTDPESIAAYAGAFVSGFSSAGVLCAAKHFPGHGSSSNDSHDGVADISARWTEAELEPFTRLFASSHAPAIVMTGHLYHDRLAPDGRSATVSSEIVTGLLRGRLGFEGAVMTDDIDMDAIRHRMGRKEAFIQALAAGHDLILTRNLFRYDPMLPQHAVHWVRDALADGTLTEAQIATAVQRVRWLRLQVEENLR